MPERVAHADEVGRCARDRERLGASSQQLDAGRYPRLRDHPGTRVDAGDERRVANDGRCLAGDEPGADADVDDHHAGAQTGL